MNTRRISYSIGILLLGWAAAPAWAVPFGTFGSGVLGQPDLTSNQANQGQATCTASTLNEPRGVAVHIGSGRLFWRVRQPNRYPQSVFSRFGKHLSLTPNSIPRHID